MAQKPKKHSIRQLDLEKKVRKVWKIKPSTKIKESLKRKKEGLRVTRELRKAKNGELEV